LPRTRFDWIVITVVVALVGSLWVGMTRVRAGASDLSAGAPRPEVGHTAPDFTLPTPDGGEIRLSDLRGRPVVVNFWATWCPPCRYEVPALEQAHRELGGDAIILGVDVQESAATVQSFASEVGMTYPVVLDARAEVARAYRVRAYPTTYFIDSRGMITHVVTGPLNEPLLYTRLAELVGR